MKRAGYMQPDSCEVGGDYFFKTNGKIAGAEYRKVKFLSYLPHPAEVLVHDGEKCRIIHRRFLYTERNQGERRTKGSVD